MPSIRVSYESKRGCGYRKEGGLYMVSGKPSAPCGKLPLPLHVCPTCAQGIKPQRAFAWIAPRPLFDAVECGLVDAELAKRSVSLAPDTRRVMRVIEDCQSCPAGGAVPEKAGLIWVGGAFYETADDFMAEARQMGISRRIPAVPKGFEPGTTWIYLAHRKVTIAGQPEQQPAIFTAFVPHAVEYVVKGTENEAELEKIEKRGISLVEVRRKQEDLPFDATPAERAMVPDA